MEKNNITPKEEEAENLRSQFVTSSLDKENRELYHVGASLKDLGKKCFAISKIIDSDYIEKICKNTL